MSIDKEIDEAFDFWVFQHRKFMLDNNERIAAYARRSRIDFEAGYRAAVESAKKPEYKYQTFDGRVIIPSG